MTAPDTFAFHARHPSGSEGYVVLLFRPHPDGRLRTREWPSEGYAAPGVDCETTVAELEARVRGWARAGWTLTEHPDRIAGWLHR